MDDPSSPLVFDCSILGNLITGDPDCDETDQEVVCDPDEMDDATVIIGKVSIVKTIHAEKQTFDSFIQQGNIPVIKDVTIIAEIYEDMNTKSIIKKQVVVVECTKQVAPADVLDCEAYVPTQDIVPVRNCNEVPVQFAPVMNTIPGAVSESDGSSMNMNTILKGKTVKTIDAQKEVFLCDLNNDQTDDKRVDVVLFTEIWEDLNGLPNDTLVKTTFEKLRCVIRIDTADVESCRFSTLPS